MMSLVFIASKQTNDLVYENYYEHEINYNKVLTAKSNFEATGSQISFSKDSLGAFLSIPDNLINQLDSGKIEFIKFDDKNADQIIDMSLLINGKYHYSQKLSPGRYMVKFQWSNKAIPYYYENNNFSVN